MKRLRTDVNCPQVLCHLRNPKEEKLVERTNERTKLGDYKSHVTCENDMSLKTPGTRHVSCVTHATIVIAFLFRK